jgi:hypothetical protein
MIVNDDNDDGIPDKQSFTTEVGDSVVSVKVPSTNTIVKPPQMAQCRCPPRIGTCGKLPSHIYKTPITDCHDSIPSIIDTDTGLCTSIPSGSLIGKSCKCPVHNDATMTEPIGTKTCSIYIVWGFDQLANVITSQTLLLRVTSGRKMSSPDTTIKGGDTVDIGRFQYGHHENAFDTIIMINGQDCIETPSLHLDVVAANGTIPLYSFDLQYVGHHRWTILEPSFAVVDSRFHDTQWRLYPRIPMHHYMADVYHHILFMDTKQIRIHQIIPTGTVAAGGVDDVVSYHDTLSKYSKTDNPTVTWSKHHNQFYLNIEGNRKPIQFSSTSRTHRRFGFSPYYFDSSNIACTSCIISLPPSPPQSSNQTFILVPSLMDTSRIRIGPFGVYQCVRIIGGEVFYSGDKTARTFEFCLLPPHHTIFNETEELRMEKKDNHLFDCNHVPVSPIHRHHTEKTSDVSASSVIFETLAMKRCVESVAGCGFYPSSRKFRVGPRRNDSMIFEDILASEYTMVTNNTVRHDHVDDTRTMMQCFGGIEKGLIPVNTFIIPLNRHARNRSSSSDGPHLNADGCDETDHKTPLYQLSQIFTLSFKQLYECHTGNDVNLLRRDNTKMLSHIEIHTRTFINDTNLIYESSCNSGVYPMVFRLPKPIQQPSDAMGDHIGDVSIFFTQSTTSRMKLIPNKRRVRFDDKDNVHLFFDLCYPINSMNESITINSNTITEQIGNEVKQVALSDTFYKLSNMPLDYQCQLLHLESAPKSFFKVIGPQFTSKVFIRVNTSNRYTVDMIVEISAYYKSVSRLAPVIHVMDDTVSNVPPEQYRLRYCFFENQELSKPVEVSRSAGKRVYVYAPLIPRQSTSSYFKTDSISNCSRSICPYGNHFRIKILTVNLCIHHNHSSIHGALTRCRGPGVERSRLIDNQGGSGIVTAPIYDPHIQNPISSYNCTSAFSFSFLIANQLVGKPLGIEVEAEAIVQEDHNMPFTFQFTTTFDHDSLDTLPENFFSNRRDDFLPSTPCGPGQYYDHWRELRCVSSIQWNISYVSSIFDHLVYIWVFLLFIIAIVLILYGLYTCGYLPTNTYQKKLEHILPTVVIPPSPPSLQNTPVQMRLNNAHTLPVVVDYADRLQLIPEDFEMKKNQ